MKTIGSLAIILFFLAVAGCAAPRSAPQASVIDTAIRELLTAQMVAWNNGSMETFLRGYAKTDGVRFASDGDVVVGWERIAARFHERYPDHDSMGRLTFANVNVTPVAGDCALAVGAWRLERNADSLGGPFSMVCRKTAEGWRITHDHKSSAR